MAKKLVELVLCDRCGSAIEGGPILKDCGNDLDLSIRAGSPAWFPPVSFEDLCDDCRAIVAERIREIALGQGLTVESGLRRDGGSLVKRKRSRGTAQEQGPGPAPEGGEGAGSGGEHAGGGASPPASGGEPGAGAEPGLFDVPELGDADADEPEPGDARVFERDGVWWSWTPDDGEVNHGEHRERAERSVAVWRAQVELGAIIAPASSMSGPS